MTAISGRRISEVADGGDSDHLPILFRLRIWKIRLLRKLNDEEFALASDAGAGEQAAVSGEDFAAIPVEKGLGQETPVCASDYNLESNLSPGGTSENSPAIYCRDGYAQFPQSRRDD